MRLLLVLLVLVSVAAAEEERPLWLAVGPKPLVAALEPLAEHRRGQGLDAQVVAGTVAEALAAAGRAPAFLVIVGDATRFDEGEDDAWHVPEKRVDFYRWRKPQPQTYASDAPYADRDGDGAPDFPVGRIPARTAEQVAVVVKKTIAYERRAPRAADFRLVVWAGAPGYGGAVDAMATKMLVDTVRNNAPRWAGRWLISADANQALCGWPADQPQLFAREVEKGALLTSISAHGNADGAFSMRFQKRAIWFTAGHAKAYWKGAQPLPPLVFLACNCGEFDREKASLAEELLFLPGGPVVTIGATTESHPLTNYYTGSCMLRAVGGKYGRLDRLGALWHEAQRRAVDERNFLIEAALKNAEGSLEPEIDTAKLRRDQSRLYALLGDPALKLPLPGELAAEVEKTDAGRRWTARKPEGAVTLVVGVRAPVAAAAPGDDRETRRQAFLAANAAQGFGEVARLGANEPWTGVVKEPGTIRLLALGRDGALVAVLE